ncbi:MAG: GH92 family glycosyl hydrolase [Actinobacteria bacterium]|nr:GH92 family glycosyl hydrolase [Actinomycetota bacterium]
MLRPLLVAALALGLVGAVPADSAGTAAVDPLPFVDPMIGSVAPGFTNPGPQLPHGMVGLGPDTEGPLNYGGYFVNNTVITGFSHTHQSAGVFHGGHVPVLPITGELAAGDLSEELAWTHPLPAYSSPFDHATEVAEVGYYAATLTRYGVRAELTATERTGMHRYTFPPRTTDAKVVIDLSRNLRGYDLARLEVIDDRTLIGTVITDVRGEYEVHTAMRFDRPVAFTDRAGEPLGPGDELQGHDVLVLAQLGDDVAEPVHLAVALSYNDTDGALQNLFDGELRGLLGERVMAFDEVRRRAEEAWRGALAPIEVTGGTDLDRTSFYTALYHAQLFPNLHSDADGGYRWDDGVRRWSERPRYSQFSLWDSYPGQNQLIAVIDPDRYRDMVASMLDLADAMGQLPQWQLAGHDAGYMSGDPAIPFVAEAWCRGLLDGESPADRERLYREMLELVDARPAEYRDLGYLPVPDYASPAAMVEGGPGSAGTTLEHGLADMSLALVADREHRAGDVPALLDGAVSYRNLQDPETGFIRPRLADGSWLTPFAPELGYGFQEGTSWQYSWLAMADMAGLVDGMGGREEAVRRLDRFFSFPATATVPVAPAKAQNQATVFGLFYYGDQYAPGNEHDLEAPWAYSYAGAPWKSAAASRGAASVFTATPDGLPGNDDLGGMSGWLVWAMLGLYPMTPGAPVYVVGSPVFTSATVHTPTGDLVIDAPGASAVATYVDGAGAALGDAALERAWITESAWRDAGAVTLPMSPVPDTAWGSDPALAPPSLSTHDLAAFDCRG